MKHKKRGLALLLMLTLALLCGCEGTVSERPMEDISALTSDELAKIETVRKELGTQFCRRCNYCAPCTVGISIPSVFLFQGYLNRYGLQQWGRERYATLQTKAGACIRCGACEPRCPYNLPIRQMMQKAAEDFGE